MKAGFVIFLGSQAYSVAQVTSEGCKFAAVEKASEITEMAAKIAQSLHSLDYRGEETLLALHSRMCLCAHVETRGLRTRNREAVLQFRLEEQLPLALEEMVTDFVAGDTKALGIGVPADVLEPTVEALESAGIPITTICPTSLLLADQVPDAARVRVTSNAILFACEDHLELIQFYGGKVSNWTVLPHDAATVNCHLRHAVSDHSPLRVHLIGVPSETRSRLLNEPLVEMIERPPENMLELAARGAGQILAGISTPAADFRQGRLASRNPLRQMQTPFRASLAAAALLGVCLSTSMLWRASQYNRLAQEAQDSKLGAFHQALPSQVAPPSITSRLMSEERRLRGISGTASELPPSQSILALLRDTLAGLPPSMRFRLVELRFEPQRFYLEGQILDHGDADRIAAAIRHSTGFTVDPPRTEQPTGEDVTFTITGSNSTSGASAGNSRGVVE